MIATLELGSWWPPDWGDEPYDEFKLKSDRSYENWEKIKLATIPEWFEVVEVKPCDTHTGGIKLFVDVIVKGEKF